MKGVIHHSSWPGGSGQTLMNGVNWCGLGWHQSTIAGSRKLLDDNLKAWKEWYVTLADLVVQVRHYITSSSEVTTYVHCMFILRMNGVNWCLGWHQGTIADSRKLLDANLKVRKEWYITLVDLVVQVRHYITSSSEVTTYYYACCFTSCSSTNEWFQAIGVVLGDTRAP